MSQHDFHSTDDRQTERQTELWVRRALSVDERGGRESVAQAVLSRIAGRSPAQLEDARRARLFMPASAVAAAVLMGLWTMNLVGERQSDQPPIDQVLNDLPPILALEEGGFHPESDAPTIFSDLLTGEFSE